MEQTIKNMELIITKFKKELNNENYSACKTMMNTYSTLLERFSRAESVDTTNNEKSLTLQREKLIELFSRIENLTYTKLQEHGYKESDTLAETSRRIENSSNKIQALIDYANAERKRKFHIMTINSKI